MGESGVPGYDVITWYILLAPARTPKDVIARLHAAATKALDDPEVKRRFAATDFEPTGSTPEQCGAFMASEIEKWAKVIRESGISTE